MVLIDQRIQHNSGIPLGGVGTGSVEIRPDGLFHDWEIFNAGPWNPNSPACKGGPAMNPEDLVFVVRTKDAADHVLTRYLALREQLHNLYHFAWIRSVEAISFAGTFPVARLTYIDDELPVQLEAEVFSPFVPLDSRTSGTPGFYVHFNIENLTDEPVEVSILGIIRNPSGCNQEARKPHNKLVDMDEALAITLGADDLTQGACSTGDMTFAALGGEISFVTGCTLDEVKGVAFRSSPYGLKLQTFLHTFQDEGQLPNLNAELPRRLAEDFKASDLTVDQRQKLLGELLEYPFVHDKHARFHLVDPEIADSPEFLDEIAKNLAELSDKKSEWGYGALCSSQTLSAEAQASALFTLGWHFPNHISPTGENIGHMYEHWFTSSLEVVEFMIDNFADIRLDTIALPESIHNSSLPAEAADAVTGQMSTLTKCTWWTRAGHFGVWEGLGCCGFHTTDITYQGSFPIISLFPDLQKMQMEHGAKFQREDGRVHHFFIPDFSKVDNGFDRVDMNQQFVMLAARDYLWTGDRGYLERLWPHIIRAMDNTALLDSDGDGLPDTDTRRNTYDVWDFKGCPSYIASLWLGALKAAIRLANEMGDKDRAAAWQSIYDNGLASFEDKLWNGEYYVLWRDGDEIDECCMSDQMSGDWFASACGWGNILKPERIKQALETIVCHNFHPGEGLLNATYPPGSKRRMAASGNWQADAPWTGIEYTVAALLIEYGMVAEGLAIVRDIHDRYLRAGRFWNHVECGGHYYRAMSSWTLLIALSGFEWDMPTGALTFAPAIDEEVSEYPFFTSGAWGSYYAENGLTGKVVEIELESGELTLGTLCLPKLSGFEGASVYVGELEADCEVKACREGICVKFASPVVLTPGSSLVVTA